MSHQESLYRTLADYQNFLHHPDPIIRGWAVDCLEHQFPEQAAENFGHLLNDPDSHLQICAVTAIEKSSEPQLFEPALLAVWSISQEGGRNWIARALGKMKSPAIRGELIAALETMTDLPLPSSDIGMEWLFPHSAAEALGYYPDAEARAALWRLLHRYPLSDRLTHTITKSLLQQAQPAELPELIRRLAEMPPGKKWYWNGFRAIAETAQLTSLNEQLVEEIDSGRNRPLDYLNFWFGQKLSFSPGFETALTQTGKNGYADLLPLLRSELEALIANRKDDLAGWLAQWQAGERPTGYPGRMVLAHQLLSAMVTVPSSQPEVHLEKVALGLALLGQAAVDQDDETALAAAPNEMFRQATLLSILGSNRPNVLPDIIERVEALGPMVIPHLRQILRGRNFWAWPRTLAVIERLARANPGAADEAVPDILDLVHLDQGDDVLDAVSATLIAIGPAAVPAMGERLGQDYVYNIFIGAALANIPTEAAAKLWLDYVAGKSEGEEIDWEYLVDLGHPAGIPFLRDHFDWRDDPNLCTALYKLAVVNGYSGPEFGHWQTIARLDYRRFQAQLKAGGKPPAKTKQHQTGSAKSKNQRTKKNKKQHSGKKKKR
jgi:HEAT repeat protein